MGKINNVANGFALVGIIAVVVVLAAIAGAGYYVLNQDKDSSTSTQLSSEEQEQVEAECKKEIDDKDFCKFASNWSLNGEFKMTITTTGGSDSGTIVSEIDGENSSTTITSESGEESKFISLNGATYTYNPETGVWLKFSSDVSSSEITDNFSEFDFDNDDVPEAERETYESLGKEACGSLTCFKYKIVDPQSPDSEQYVWFDDKEYQLRRFQIIDTETTTDATVEYVDVNITEPSPVEEYTQPEGVPTEAELQELLNSIPQ